MPPGFEKERPVFLDHGDGTPHVSVRHAALRDDGEVYEINTGLTLSVDMGMRRLVIGRVNNEAHPVLTQNRDHEDYNPTS
jgi:hypothetical protein